MAKDFETNKRYCLCDAWSLQVMVVALCQLIEFEIDLNAGRGSQYKLFELRDKLLRYSNSLYGPDVGAEIAAKVTIRDFHFSPAELFKYQRLVFFLLDDRPDMWPLVDRETPIARNKGFGGARFLFELVDDWMAWNADKNSAPDPADPSWYSADVKFLVFQHLTRKLWGGGKGNLINSKIRAFDGVRDAASFAIQLMNGHGLSEDTAICEALEKYPRIGPGDAEELNCGHIVSASDEAAEKRVEREIKKIKAEIKAEIERSLANRTHGTLNKSLDGLKPKP